jgi:hypothetical protein
VAAEKAAAEAEAARIAEEERLAAKKAAAEAEAARIAEEERLAAEKAAAEAEAARIAEEERLAAEMAAAEAEAARIAEEERLAAKKAAAEAEAARIAEEERLAVQREAVKATVARVTGGRPEPANAGLRHLLQEQFDPYSEWLMYTDDDGVTPFYVHTRTGQREWSLPVGAGVLGNADDEVEENPSSHWLAYFDCSKYPGGEPYFYNTVTGATVWEAPPEGVAEVIRDGSSTIAAEPAAATAAVVESGTPDSSPVSAPNDRHPPQVRAALREHYRAGSSWRVMSTDDSDHGGPGGEQQIYYFDSSTGRTTWDPPSEGVGGIFEDGDDGEDAKPADNRRAKEKKRRASAAAAKVDKVEAARAVKEREERVAAVRRKKQARARRERQRKQEAVEAFAAAEAGALLLQRLCRTLLAQHEMRKVRKAHQKRLDREREVAKRREQEERQRQLEREEKQRRENEENCAVVRDYPWEVGEEVRVWSRSRDEWVFGVVKGHKSGMDGTAKQLVVNYGQGQSEQSKNVDLAAPDLLEHFRPVQDLKTLRWKAKQKKNKAKGALAQPVSQAGIKEKVGNGGITHFEVEDQCVFLDLEQTANKAGRAPTTFFVFDIWWRGSRYEIRKRYSMFEQLDKALRPLLASTDDATPVRHAVALIANLLIANLCTAHPQCTGCGWR